MPSLRTTAVAALATAALVVPATASAQSGVHTGVIGPPTQLQVNVPVEAKNEAATAAAISTQPSAPASSQPAADEWTYCAPEGGNCAFTGTRQVRYGANGKFTAPRTVTGGVACNNAVFGDPVPYVVKQCQVTAASQMKDEAATAAAIMAHQVQAAEISRQAEMAANVAKATQDTHAQMARNIGP